MPLIDFDSGESRGGVRTPYTKNKAPPFFRNLYADPQSHPLSDVVRSAYASLLSPKPATTPTRRPFGTTREMMLTSLYDQWARAVAKGKTKAADPYGHQGIPVPPPPNVRPQPKPWERTSPYSAPPQ